jgi:hypothetical protein
MPSEQWMRDVQAELAALRRHVEQLQDRAPVACESSQIRLAQTVEKSGTTYPIDGSGADTFWFVFVDATFTEAQGNQTPTYKTNQPTTAPMYLAHCIEGAWYPESSRVWVAWQNGRWWIIGKVGYQARWITFVVNDATGFSTTDASVTVDGVAYFDGYEPASPVTTVYNLAISANRLFEGDDDDVGMAIYDPAGDKYHIFQMECP